MSKVKVVFRWAAGAVLTALGFQTIYTLLNIQAI